MAFKEIKTQEEFDSAIKDRLERQAEKLAKDKAEALEALKAEFEKEKAEILSSAKDSSASEFEEVKKKLDEALKENETSKQKIHDFELASLKGKIAQELHIPQGAIKYLSGETEDEIKKSAEDLSQFVKIDQPKPAPLANTEKVSEDAVTKRFKELNPDIKL